MKPHVYVCLHVPNRLRKLLSLVSNALLDYLLLISNAWKMTANTESIPPTMAHDLHKKGPLQLLDLPRDILELIIKEVKPPFARLVLLLNTSRLPIPTTSPLWLVPTRLSILLQPPIFTLASTSFGLRSRVQLIRTLELMLSHMVYPL